MPYEQVLDTMLHELAHISRGPHDAQFYKLWDELRKVRNPYVDDSALLLALEYLMIIPNSMSQVYMHSPGLLLVCRMVYKCDYCSYLLQVNTFHESLAQLILTTTAFKAGLVFSLDDVLL
jgi:hypothetical protein